MPLLAGGSGVTFTLGAFDNFVGRIVCRGRHGGERMHQIEFAWCARALGHRARCGVVRCRWSGTSRSTGLAYMACLCNPGAIPLIPNCSVMIVEHVPYPARPLRHHASSTAASSCARRRRPRNLRPGSRWRSWTGQKTSGATGRRRRACYVIYTLRDSETRAS